MSKYKVIIVFLLSLFVVSSAYAQDSIDRHIYWVEIPPTKTHGKIIQTGFRLQGTNGIITALHGVVGGDNFKALNKFGKIYINLELVEVDVDRDLALLRNDELLKSDEGLQPSEKSVTAGQLLWGFGYPLAIKEVYKRRIHAGDPVTKQLDKLIPVDTSGNALRKRGSPNKLIDVLNVEGSLSPGESGAPVLNADNQVVGIVDGGLRNAGINWAIPLKTISWASPRLVEDDLARLNTLDIHLFVLGELSESIQMFPGNDCNSFQTYHAKSRGKNTNWSRGIEEMTAISDQLTVVQNFYLCTYSFSTPIRWIDLNFEGATINFSSSLGSGGGLALMVYNRVPDLKNLTSWNSYGNPKWSTVWSKEEKNPTKQIIAPSENFKRIDLGFETKQISVALVLVDAWEGIDMNLKVKDFSFQVAN